jgi:hypothetical protein
MSTSRFGNLFKRAEVTPDTSADEELFQKIINSTKDIPPPITSPLEKILTAEEIMERRAAQSQKSNEQHETDSNVTISTKNAKLSPQLTAPSPKEVLSAGEIIKRRAIEQSQKYNERHEIGFNEKILPGFQDGGRFVKWNDLGEAINKPIREIIQVKSLQQDPDLEAAVKEVKNHFNDNPTMNELEKVVYLHKYTNKKIKTIYRDPWPAGGKIILGQFLKEGKGLCRHKALFMKILADQVGLKAKLVRGWYDNPVIDGAHVWNVFKLENGEEYLSDSTLNTKFSINHDVVKNAYYKAGLFLEEPSG